MVESVDSFFFAAEYFAAEYLELAAD